MSEMKQGKKSNAIKKRTPRTERTVSRAQWTSTAMILIAVLLLSGFAFYAYTKLSQNNAAENGAASNGALQTTANANANAGGPVENLIRVLDSANEYVFTENKITVVEKANYVKTSNGNDGNGGNGGNGKTTYKEELDFANAGEKEFEAGVVDVVPPLMQRYYRYANAANAQRGLTPNEKANQQAPVTPEASSELFFQNDENGNEIEKIVLSEEIAPNVYFTELRIEGGGVLRTYAQAEVNSARLAKPIHLLTKPGLTAQEKNSFARLAEKINAVELSAEQSAALEKRLNDAYVETRGLGETLDEWFYYADALAESIAANGFEQAMTANQKTPVEANHAEAKPVQATPSNPSDYAKKAGGVKVTGSTDFAITEITPNDQRLLSVTLDGQPVEFLYSFEGKNAALFSAEKISSTSETPSATLLLVKADYSRTTLSNAFFPFTRDTATLKLWFPKTLEYKTVALTVFATREKLRDPADPWKELASAQAKETVYPQSLGDAEAWSKTNGLRGKRVFIDAGHGSGVTANAKYGDSNGYSYGAGAFVNGKRVWECDLNLAVALKLKTLLEANGATVALSRNENVNGFLNLTARAAIANAWNADVVVSVHHDEANAAAKKRSPMEYYPEVNVYGGANAYCEDRCGESKKLADAVDAEIKKISAVAGESKGPAPDYKRGFRLGLLHKTYAPSIIVEVTWMANPNAFKPEFQQQAAQSIFQGIKAYFDSREAPDSTKPEAAQSND